MNTVAAALADRVRLGLVGAGRIGIAHATLLHATLLVALACIESVKTATPILVGKAEAR
jgi:hypothetical protein